MALFWPHRSLFFGTFGSTSGNLYLGGKFAKELVLLGVRLVATMTVLGGGIDELDINLLGLPRLGGREEGLADGERSLASSHDTTLDEQEVFVDDTVVGEAAHRGDVFGNGISLAGSIVLNSMDGTSSNTVDLLVNFRSGMVTLLTTAGNSPLNGRRMPRTDTGNFAETSMSLTVKTGAAKSLDWANHTFTAGNTDGVDHLVVLEDVTDLELGLKFAVGPVDLLVDGATVDLDLHNVSLVLAELELADLGGAENTHDSAVFLDAGKVACNGILVSLGLVVALLVLAESLLLGVHPVLVHAALNLIIEMFGPDGREGTETTWGLNIADQTDNLHGRALHDTTSVHNILLDHLFTFTTFLVLDNVSHTGLVTHESGEVDWLGCVIAGEASNAAMVVTGAPLGQVGK